MTTPTLSTRGLTIGWLAVLVFAQAPGCKTKRKRAPQPESRVPPMAVTAPKGEDPKRVSERLESAGRHCQPTRPLGWKARVGGLVLIYDGQASDATTGRVVRWLDRHVELQLTRMNKRLIYPIEQIFPLPTTSRRRIDANAIVLYLGGQRQSPHYARLLSGGLRARIHTQHNRKLEVGYDRIVSLVCRAPAK